MKNSIGKTVLAGILGGVCLNAILFLTFRLLGFGWHGDGILLDSTLQSPKLIAVWTELNPLPLVLTHPPVIILGLVPVCRGAYLRLSVARAALADGDHASGVTPGRVGILPVVPVLRILHPIQHVWGTGPSDWPGTAVLGGRGFGRGVHHSTRDRKSRVRGSQLTHLGLTLCA